MFKRDWKLMRMSGARKLLLLVLLAFAGAHTAPAFAIEEDMLHQQNFDTDSTTDQVQAKPKSADPSLGFLERYAPPKNITTLNSRIDWLFRYTSWTASVFFLIMAGALVYFIIANRERPGHKAYYTHGTSKANGLVTRLLDISVFISLDLVLIAASFRDTRDIVWAYPSESDPDVVRIMVMPQQWAWNFKYAGNDGKFGTADDINLINDLRVPKGKKVLLQIKSKDVIHGFMIPNLRIQVDALPGVVTKMWFDTTTTGDFEIACYHHCGTSHYKMKAFFTVMEDADYSAWVKEQSNWAEAMYDKDDDFVHWGWNWTPTEDKSTHAIEQVSTSEEIQENNARVKSAEAGQGTLAEKASPDLSKLAPKEGEPATTNEKPSENSAAPAPDAKAIEPKGGSNAAGSNGDGAKSSKEPVHE